MKCWFLIIFPLQGTHLASSPLCVGPPSLYQRSRSPSPLPTIPLSPSQLASHFGQLITNPASIPPGANITFMMGNFYSNPPAPVCISCKSMIMNCRPVVPNVGQGFCHHGLIKPLTSLSSLSEIAWFILRYGVVTRVGITNSLLTTQGRLFTPNWMPGVRQACAVTKLQMVTRRTSARGGGGGVLRCCLDGGARLKPPNPYPSLRVILAEKGTHY